MKSILSIQQILGQLYDKCLKSFNLTTEVTTRLGNLFSFADDNVNVKLEDLADVTDVKETIDYFKNSNGSTFSLLNKVFNLKVTETFQDEWTLQATRVLSNGLSSAIPVASYNEAIGEAIIYPCNNSQFNLTDVCDNLVQSANINQVILDGVSVARDYGSTVAADPDTVLTMQNRFITLVNSHIEVMKGDVSSTFELISQGLTSGPLGLIKAIQSLYTSLSHATTSDDQFNFIDNSSYSIQHFGIGTILDNVSNLLSFLTPVLASANIVLGIIGAGVSLVTSLISNLVSDNVDRATYACVANDDAPYLEFPYGVLKGQFSKANEQVIYNRILEESSTLNEFGSCRYQLPGFSLYLYQDTENEIIYYQCRLSALTTQDAVTVLANEGVIDSYHFSQSAVYNTDFISFDFQDLTSSEKMNLLMSKWYDCCDNSINGASASDNNSILLSRARNSLSWVIIFLWAKYMDGVSQSTYTYTWNSTPSIEGDWWLILGNCIKDNYSQTYQCTSWDGLYKDGQYEYGERQIIPWLYDNYSNMTASAYTFHYFRTYIYSIITDVKTIENMSWYPYGDAKLYESFRSLGKDFISIPKYNRAQFIKALILITVATVAIVATAVVVSCKLSKAIKSKRANLKAKAEANWESFKNNPTAENYNAYYKSVKKNNAFVKIFGGSALSKNGYWDSVDDLVTSGNSYTIEDIIKLIKG